MTQLEFIRQTLAQPYNQEINYKAMASALLAEVDRLTNEVMTPLEDVTHQCIDCHHRYTPVGENEDCPMCGCNGKTSWPFPPTKGSPVSGRFVGATNSDDALI